MAEDRGHGEPGPDNMGRLDRAARRMTALSQFLRAATGLLWRGGILIVLLVASILLLSRAGRFFGPGSVTRKAPAEPVVVAAPPQIDWSRVDAAVVAAAAEARRHAEQYAAGQLDAWNRQMLSRIDQDFLPWYFGYWNQQVIGLKACWQGIKYELAGYVTADATPSPAEQMIQDIQTEFANRVLHPESAQLRLEQITRQGVALYLAELGDRLKDIQVRYSIPPQQWDRYLEGIATSVQRIDGNRQVPLSLKAITASTAGAAAILTRSLARLAARFEVRLAAGAAERPVAGLAGRAASKVAARAGGKMLGPVVAVGVIAWDVWDHHCTVAQNQPILRSALAEYLSLQNDALLRDPQAGVLAAVHEVEAGIVRSLAPRNQDGA
jgi:plasmid stabilization system protein ParE